MDKRLRGNAAGTADPTDERDIPYHITSHSAIKLEGSFAGVAIAQRLAGHGSADSKRLLLHLIFFYLAFSPAFTSLKSLCLYPQVFLLLPFRFSPTSHGVRGELCGLSCLLGSTHNRTKAAKHPKLIFNLFLKHLKQWWQQTEHLKI